MVILGHFLGPPTCSVPGGRGAWSDPLGSGDSEMLLWGGVCRGQPHVTPPSVSWHAACVWTVVQSGPGSGAARAC